MSRSTRIRNSIFTELRRGPHTRENLLARVRGAINVGPPDAMDAAVAKAIDGLIADGLVAVQGDSVALTNADGGLQADDHFSVEVHVDGKLVEDEGFADPGIEQFDGQGIETGLEMPECPDDIGTITHKALWGAVQGIGPGWFKCPDLRKPSGRGDTTIKKWLKLMQAEGHVESNDRPGKARAYRTKRDHHC